MKFSKLAMSVAIAVAGLTQVPAHATNGMLMIGAGFRSQGMGGVGIASGRDAISVGANPANAVNAGMRGDMGVAIFNAERSARIDTDLGIGTFDFEDVGNVESDNKYFVMPEMGMTMPLTERLSVGMAFIPAGGGGTTYRKNFFSYSPGLKQYPNVDTTLGVEVMQLNAPISVAYKVTEDHAVGASLVFGVQRFRAFGLGAFLATGSLGGPLHDGTNSQLLSDSSHLTDNGFDYSYGAGVRLGWLGDFMDDKLSVGLTYASKTYMTKFDKYRGLFAEYGDFDMPENYGIGIALKPAKNLTVAADIVRINYAGVRSIGNRGPETGAGTDGIQSISDPLALLGLDLGMGFGWENQTVYKLGVNYGLNERWQLRAGYNYGKSPMPDDQVTFGALAPAVTEKHYTVGFTYKPNDNLEVTGTYLYAAPNSQSNTGQNVVGGVDIGMHQNMFAMSFGWVLDPGVTDYGDTPSDPISFGSGDRGFYAGLGLGQSKAGGWKATNFAAQLAAVEPDALSSVDEWSTGFKAYAGYQFNKYFAIEGGFADLNDTTASVAYMYTAVVPGTSYFTAENDAWMLAAKGTLPLTANLSVFAKLGASHWSSNQRVTSTYVPPVPPDQLIFVAGYPQQDVSKDGVDAYYGVGVSYDLLDFLAVRVEWERFKFDAPNIDHIDLMTAGLAMKFW